MPLLYDVLCIVGEETAKEELLDEVQVERAQVSDFKRRDVEELDIFAASLISHMGTVHLQLYS